MKILFGKLILSFVCIFLVLNTTHAKNNHEVISIECKLPGCQVRCLFKETDWKSFGFAKSVEMTLYNSGTTKLLLNKGLKGNHTIVVGPEGYICSIENQKN